MRKWFNFGEQGQREPEPTLSSGQRIHAISGGEPLLLRDDEAEAAYEAMREIAGLDRRMGPMAANALISRMIPLLEGRVTSTIEVGSPVIREHRDPVEEWEARHAQEQLDRLEEEIERLRSRIEESFLGGVNRWDVDGLERTASYTGSGWNDALQQRFGPRLEQLRADAARVAREGRITVARSQLEEALEGRIANVTSVARIRTTLVEVEELLQALGALGPGEAANLRAARERIGRYRSEKRFDQAEVARAGGNEKKASRLEREAAVMLAQDWADLFPNEQPPAR